MPAASISTWDDSPSRRPSLDDVGGAVIEEEEPLPPRDGSFLTADMCNQWQRQIAALGRVAESLVFTLVFDVADDPSDAPGVPRIDAVASPVTAAKAATSALVHFSDGDKLVATYSLFTVTDNADGDTTVTWPDGAFPAASCVTATPHSDTPVMCTAELVANGVRVRTWDSTGTAVDCPVTVEVT